MIIKFQSANPEFANIILKNPLSNNGLYLMELKRGHVVGHYPSSNEYHFVFQDSKYSYSNNDRSNMLDSNSFCNPKIVLDILSDAMKHTLKPAYEYFAMQNPWQDKPFKETDTPHPCSALFYINIDSAWANTDNIFVINKYFPEVTVQHQVGKLYLLEIKGNMTLHRLFNLTALVSMFLAVTNYQEWHISESLIEKYIRIMENIGNIPYFIIYLFKIRLLFYPERFEKFKSSLESLVPGLDLKYSNTHDMRKASIKSLFDGSNSILDVGCGELQYSKIFLPKLTENKTYYAVDIDPAFEKIAKAIDSRYDRDLKFSTNLDDFLNINEKVDVLCTEVIEHLEVEDAKALLESLKRFDMNSLVITTPNVDFNKFYRMSEEDDTMRHHDHKFEMRFEEFKTFINSIFGGNTLEFFQIGDSMDGICPTSAVKIIF